MNIYSFSLRFNNIEPQNSLSNPIENIEDLSNNVFCDFKDLFLQDHVKTPTPLFINTLFIKVFALYNKMGAKDFETWLSQQVTKTLDQHADNEAALAFVLEIALLSNGVVISGEKEKFDQERKDCLGSIWKTLYPFVEKYCQNENLRSSVLTQLSKDLNGDLSSLQNFYQLLLSHLYFYSPNKGSSFFQIQIKKNEILFDNPSEKDLEEKKTSTLCLIIPKTDLLFKKAVQQFPQPYSKNLNEWQIQDISKESSFLEALTKSFLIYSKNFEGLKIDSTAKLNDLVASWSLLFQHWLPEITPEDSNNKLYLYSLTRMINFFILFGADTKELQDMLKRYHTALLNELLNKDNISLDQFKLLNFDKDKTVAELLYLIPLEKIDILSKHLTSSHADLLSQQLGTLVEQTNSTNAVDLACLKVLLIVLKLIPADKVRFGTIEDKKTQIERRIEKFGNFCQLQISKEDILSSSEWKNLEILLDVCVNHPDLIDTQTLLSFASQYDVLCRKSNPEALPGPLYWKLVQAALKVSKRLPRNYSISIISAINRVQKHHYSSYFSNQENLSGYLSVLVLLRTVYKLPVNSNLLNPSNSMLSIFQSIFEWVLATGNQDRTLSALNIMADEIHTWDLNFFSTIPKKKPYCEWLESQLEIVSKSNPDLAQRIIFQILKITQDLEFKRYIAFPLSKQLTSTTELPYNLVLDLYFKIKTHEKKPDEEKLKSDCKDLIENLLKGLSSIKSLDFQKTKHHLLELIINTFLTEDTLSILLQHLVENQFSDDYFKTALLRLPFLPIYNTDSNKALTVFKTEVFDKKSISLKESDLVGIALQFPTSTALTFILNHFDPMHIPFSNEDAQKIIRMQSRQTEYLKNLQTDNFFEKFLKFDFQQNKWTDEQITSIVTIFLATQESQYMKGAVEILSAHAKKLKGDHLKIFLLFVGDVIVSEDNAGIQGKLLSCLSQVIDHLQQNDPNKFGTQALAIRLEIVELIKKYLSEDYESETFQALMQFLPLKDNSLNYSQKAAFFEFICHYVSTFSNNPRDITTCENLMLYHFPHEDNPVLFTELMQEIRSAYSKRVNAIGLCKEVGEFWGDSYQNTPISNQREDLLEKFHSKFIKFASDKMKSFYASKEAKTNLKESRKYLEQFNNFKEIFYNKALKHASEKDQKIWNDDFNRFAAYIECFIWSCLPKEEKHKKAESTRELLSNLKNESKLHLTAAYLKLAQWYFECDDLKNGEAVLAELFSKQRPKKLAKYIFQLALFYRNLLTQKDLSKAEIFFQLASKFLSPNEMLELKIQAQPQKK